MARTLVNTISGGGGAAAAQSFNLLIDPSFESGAAQFDVAPLTATFAYENHLEDGGIYSPTNLSYINVVNVGADTLSVSRSENHDSELQGTQGTLTIWLKTASTGFKVGVVIDGVDPSQDNIDQLVVSSDDKWKRYEIPFTFGTTSVGYKVYSNTSQINDIDIDNIYLGIAPDNYVSKIDTTIEDMDKFYNVPSSGGGTLTFQYIEGSYGRTGDRINIAIRGRVGNAGSGTSTVLFELPDNLKIDFSKIPVSGAGAVIGDMWGQTSSFQDVVLTANSSLGDNVFALITQGSSAFKTGTDFTAGMFFQMTVYSLPIVGWSSEYSTVVTQNTELTAQTANEFTFAFSSSREVTNENFDWINGNGVSSGTNNHVATFTFNSNIFSSTPNCSCTTRGGSNSYCSIINSSTNQNQLVVATYLGGVTSEVGGEINCTRSTDYNKSATIIGKFENIKSDSIGIVWNGSASQDYTGGSGTVKVTYPAANLAGNASGITFDDANDRFIVSKAGYYEITVGSQETDPGGTGMYSFVAQNGTVDTGTRCGGINEFASGNFCSFIKYANAGDYFEHYIGGTVGSLTYESLKFYVKELPDTQSIVKNLLAESSQTKCQTKYLSGDVTSNTADITDLKFQNLTVGKKYRVYFNTSMFAASDPSIIASALHNGVYIVRAGIGNSAGGTQTFANSTGDFTASTTTLTFETTGFSNTNQILYGDNSSGLTFARLCQLPDTYVDTDEW